jgi:23S rRNA pseudouridine2605 synthase
MAKRNSSGSTGNRRGSSRSNTGTGKSFSGRSSDKPNNKFDKKDDSKKFSKDKKGPSASGDERRSSGKSFSKPDKRDDARGFSKDKRTSSSSDGRTFSGARKSSSRSFSKPDRKEEDTRGGFSKDRRSSSGDERGSGDSRKSFGKPDKREETGKRDNTSYSKNPRPRREEGFSSRPSFKKDDSGDRKIRPGAGRSDSGKRPFRKEGDSDEKKRGFSESKRGFSASPSKKFDKPARGEESSSDETPRKRLSSSAKPRFRSGDRTKRPIKREIDENLPTDPDKIRLNRYIANSGICSRREADEFIKMGLVSVNGKVITELGHKVNRTDEVRYESKVLKAEKPVYILMNKPKGYLTTTKDPQERNTVMHILGSAVKERVYPVGRLDRNTTGLLLLTNDGDLADKLMHPSYDVKKIYKVELDKPITKADFKKIQEGNVRLEEGKALVDDLAIISDDNKTVGIEIHIGWNRVVRRIFESLEYSVVKLDRSFYAGLDKKDLPRGHWRYLKKEEVVILKHFK